MHTNLKDSISIETLVHKPIEIVWEMWTMPRHIIVWNTASEDWHTPQATSDLSAGGKFSYRMEAKDGSMGFDMAGVFDEVELHRSISYTMGDGRRVNVTFTDQGGNTLVKEEFEPESTNSHELQKSGWQSILNNFKEYAEQQ